MKSNFPFLGQWSVSWNHLGQRHILWDSARTARSLSDLHKSWGDSRHLQQGPGSKSNPAACRLQTQSRLPDKDEDRSRSRSQRIPYCLSTSKPLFFVRCAAFDISRPVLSAYVSHWKQHSSSHKFTPEHPRSIHGAGSKMEVNQRRTIKTIKASWNVTDSLNKSSLSLWKLC